MSGWFSVVQESHKFEIFSNNDNDTGNARSNDIRNVNVAYGVDDDDDTIMLRGNKSDNFDAYMGPLPSNSSGRSSKKKIGKMFFSCLPILG